MVFNEFIKSTKDGVYVGLQFLPLFTGSSLLTIGSASANYSFLYVFLGMFVLVPLAVIILAAIPFLALFKGSESIFPIVSSTADAAGISYGYSMMIFFFSYLITNAAYIIKTNSEAVVRGRMSISIIIAGISALTYLFMRIKNFSKVPESTLGLVVLGLAAAGLGYSWYYLLYSCNKSNVADIYGVENNIAISKAENKVCVAFAA
jgi:hypothetical protein